MKKIKCPFGNCNYSRMVDPEGSPLENHITCDFIEHFLSKHSPRQLAYIAYHFLAEEFLRKRD